jgi:hypothetical protein
MQIEKPLVEVMPHPLMGVLHRTMINPHAQATQNYSIVEYLSKVDAGESLHVSQLASQPRRVRMHSKLKGGAVLI